MILQALTEYYNRKAADPDAGLAPEGFELKAIPFFIVLDKDGQLVQLADRREGEGRARRAKAVLVPQAVKKSVNIAADLLWGTAEYVLGIDTRGKPDRVARAHESFRRRLTERFGHDPQDEGVAAVITFLDDRLPVALASFAMDPAWPEIVQTNPFVTFELLGDTVPVCQRPAVVAELSQASRDEPDGFCLVSGEPDVIARLHPPIKGVWGSQTSGANIVSFNLDAFTSYGKAQSYNAPVGEKAAFAYTTALNHLLARDSRQRVQVGDASTVFWAEKASGAAFEQAFLDFVNPSGIEREDGAQAVASLFRSVRDGHPFTSDDGQSFYVLGLSPNASRLAVRSWHAATVEELGQAFYRYFDEVDIVRPTYDATAPLTLFRLLVSIAPLQKADAVPPNLAGDVMRAILTGGRYPETLMLAALRRIRAEQAVTWPRAALLKACLIRNLDDKEVHVSLNEDNTDVGYRLGRLFAALERAQERAQGNLNASIRERYYGAFAATPVTVLPLLMKLKNHHLAKLPNRGEAVNFEKLFGTIIDGIDDIPPRLMLAEQARFAVGYYQQRQAFFSTPDAAAERQSEGKE